MATQLMQDFPELAALSREDLECLLSDPAYFQAIFHSLSHTKALLASQTELGMANEAIAKRNLALQGELYDLRSTTKDAYDRARDLQNRWAAVDREQREVYQRFTPSFLLMRLRHATIAQDDASEAAAAAFVQSSQTTKPAEATPQELEDFVKEFKELRKTYHKRVFWGDQWNSGKVTWRDD
ncbi:modifier of rudimentary (Mod(r)) domain-containing protein [Ceratobasidium sp. AG-Ba]|nr:modifier of rudimentary (Mod(r)) domain-containing protein [Ceratobasidium sp. AG-Ba]QRV92510.1 modifier of rudimentary (Mod(r)) domain-containing protein [Ceratobasidium sp. AG-Ba]QRW06636.1 modifier of rudimentary (Mod(r)) domain-containing protein [Ceratobasidium sp. AG-Ba]